MTNLEQEKVIFQKAFKGNKEALQLTQALMLGLDLTNEEKDLIRGIFASEELREAFRHRFLPKLSKSTPIGQQSDEWAGVEDMVYGHNPDTIEQAVKYKKGAIELTKIGLALLENPDGLKPDLSYDPDEIPVHENGVGVKDFLAIRLLTRNMYIKHVQSILSIIWVIAEMKDTETPQQTADRIRRDSTQ